MRIILRVKGDGMLTRRFLYSSHLAVLCIHNKEKKVMKSDIVLGTVT